MTKFRTLTACALSAMIALPASAQTRPSLWDVLHPERLAERLIVGLMPTLRIFAEVRYEHLDIDFAATRVSVTGLTIASIPQLPGCRASADRLMISGTPIDDLETYRATADIAGLTFTAACLGPDAAQPLALIAPDGVAADRAHLALVYSAPSGAAQLTLDLDAPDLAAIDVAADFDYLSIMSVPREEPAFGETQMPLIRLNSALIRLEDRGLYTALGPLLPPQISEPAQIRLMAMSGLMGGFMELNGGAPATPEQSEFAEALSGALVTMLEDGTPVVVETGATGPVLIDGETINDPAELFASLAPRVVNRPTPPVALLDAALLAQALDASARDDLDGETRREVALALATGQGAPKAPALAAAVLGDVASTPALDLALAEAIAASDPEGAYRRALAAAAAGQAGALGLLDRLEDTLPAASVIELQGAAAKAPIDADFESPRAIRNAAFARMTGTQAPRDYAGAYYFATLAAATGDRAAQALLDQIDETIRLSGDGTFWLAQRDEIRGRALADWVSRDLSAAFDG